MHLLFLNNVRHLLQLMEYQVFWLIELIFDLLKLVLLVHCFEFLYNNHHQKLFYAIMLFLLPFQFGLLIKLDLLLLQDMHLGILCLHGISLIFLYLYEVYSNIHQQNLMKPIYLNFCILHYFLQAKLSDSNGCQFLLLFVILNVVQHILHILLLALRLLFYMLYKSQWLQTLLHGLLLLLSPFLILLLLLVSPLFYLLRLIN